MASRGPFPALALTTCLLASGAAAADISASRERELTTLLLHDCGACHGLTMKGGLGPPLAPERIGWWSDEAIAAVILDGVPGTPMPPWRVEITPNEATWMAQRLKQGLTHEN